MTPIEPMRATTTDQLPTDDDRWAFEVKWDGYRAVVSVENGDVRVMSRSSRDMTADYPQLAALADAVGALDVILDGEIVAFDEHGRPSFQAMQQRGRQPDQVRYLVFDVLAIAGQSTVSLTYVDRRRLLDQLGLVDGNAWDVPPYQVGGGSTLLAATREQGLEGVIAKRLDGRYEPGRRSRSWLKIKHWASQELVIGGWLPGKGMRSGGVGSLLVGYYDEVGLHYAGRVGTGFTDAELQRLAGLLAPRARETSPFVDADALPLEVRRDAHFAKPDLVAEVAFSEWTSGGTIRQPSYKGLRHDKPAHDVVREG